MQLIEWQLVGTEYHGFLKGHPETCLYLLQPVDAVMWRLQGAFVPDKRERTPGSGSISVLQAEAERLMKEWVGFYFSAGGSK